MTDEFSSAGIALEQYLNIVEPNVEPSSTPSNVDLPPQPTHTIDQPPTDSNDDVETLTDDIQLVESSSDQVEHTEQTIETEEQPTINLQSAPVADELSSANSGMIKQEVPSIKESTIDESEPEPIESLSIDVAPATEVPEDILELSDEELFNEDSEYLPEQSSLTYGDKEEVDFRLYQNPVTDNEETETMDSQYAQSETANQPISDVETTTEPQPEANAPEIGRVIGMISDKVTYVHSGMKVTHRDQHSSDAIGMKVVL